MERIEPCFNSCEVTKCFNKSEFIFLTDNLNISSGFLAQAETTNSHLDAIIGALVALIVNLLFSLRFHLAEKQYPQRSIHIIKDETVVVGALLVLFVLLSPLLIISLVVAAAYKGICTLIISTIDDKFAGLLDSFDVFWTLDEDVNRSIIHVFGRIESNCPEDLVGKIGNRLKPMIPSRNKTWDKIFYRRSEKYGFYYWRRNSNINMDEYVNLVQIDSALEFSQDSLETMLSVVSCRPLPYNDEGLFQILVTNKAVTSTKARQEYGIVFRIHHSVGDGVALLKFLCETLADSEEEPSLRLNIENLNCGNTRSPQEMIDKIRKLSQIPICLIKCLLREPDCNHLHGPKLTGKTVFAWIENDDLLPKLKDIKATVNCLKFGEVIVSAAAKGVKNLLEKRMTNVPEEVSAIIPIRFADRRKQKSRLENNFTVSILSLHIPQHDATISQLQVMKRRCDELRTSAEPITNDCFLRLVGSTLPKQILSPMLASRHATLVLSNLIGPDAVTICGGKLNGLVFFVPNKGTTGIGITSLTYDGILRFAASADEALVKSNKELKVILKGMVDEVNTIHSIVTR